MTWYHAWDESDHGQEFIAARVWCGRCDVDQQESTTGLHAVRHYSDAAGLLLGIEYFGGQDNPFALTDDHRDAWLAGWTVPWANWDSVVFPCQLCAVLYEQSVIAAGHARYGGPDRTWRVLDPSTN